MRTLAFSFLFLISLACGLPAGFAQTPAGTVEGVVLDPDGLRLPGAIIELVENGRRTFSNAEGKYQLGDGPPGQYTLRALAAGLRDVQIDNIVVRAGEITSQTISFTLIKPSSTQIDVIGEDISILTEIPGAAALVREEQLQ